MKRNRKGVGDEERALFREAMRDVTPLADDRRTPPATPAKKQPSVPIEVPREVRSRNAIADGSGVQARTRLRLRRGQLRPEATLDLHGLTRHEAHAALEGFLERAHRDGRRCVLVIHGIGRGSQLRGVLRDCVPQWLDAHPEVLASSPAQPSDGGAGARYVLLRRPPPPR